MRTTLEIPQGIMEELLNVVKVKKKSEAVRIALEDFIRRKKREKLLELSGKIEIEDNTQKLEKVEINELKSVD